MRRHGSHLLIQSRARVRWKSIRGFPPLRPEDTPKGYRADTSSRKGLGASRLEDVYVRRRPVEFAAISSLLGRQRASPRDFAASCRHRALATGLLSGGMVEQH